VRSHKSLITTHQKVTDLLQAMSHYHPISYTTFSTSEQPGLPDA